MMPPGMHSSHMMNGQKPRYRGDPYSSRPGSAGSCQSSHHDRCRASPGGGCNALPPDRAPSTPETPRSGSVLHKPSLESLQEDNESLCSAHRASVTADEAARRSSGTRSTGEGGMENPCVMMEAAGIDVEAGKYVDTGEMCPNRLCQQMARSSSVESTASRGRDSARSFSLGELVHTDVETYRAAGKDVDRVPLWPTVSLPPDTPVIELNSVPSPVAHAKHESPDIPTVLLSATLLDNSPEGAEGDSQTSVVQESPRPALHSLHGSIGRGVPRGLNDSRPSAFRPLEPVKELRAQEEEETDVSTARRKRKGPTHMPTPVHACTIPHFKDHVSKTNVMSNHNPKIPRISHPSDSINRPPPAPSLMVDNSPLATVEANIEQVTASDSVRAPRMTVSSKRMAGKLALSPPDSSHLEEKMASGDRGEGGRSTADKVTVSHDKQSPQVVVKADITNPTIRAPNPRIVYLTNEDVMSSKLSIYDNVQYVYHDQVVKPSGPLPVQKYSF